MRTLTPNNLTDTTMKTEIIVWAFLDKESQKLYQPDVCPIFTTRAEAREEVKRAPVYYSNGKYVKCTLTYKPN